MPKPEQSRWEVKWVRYDYYQPEEGWEPFAVTSVGVVSYIWLKRIVTEKRK